MRVGTLDNQPGDSENHSERILEKMRDFEHLLG